MKKKMAIILSLILTCSMSMTALAAPSPSVETGTLTGADTNSSTNTVVISDQEVTVPGSTASSTLGQAINVTSATSAILAGTAFKDALGAFVDAAKVKLVVTPATIQETQIVANELAEAISSKKVKIFNYTGRSALSLLDNNGNLNVLKHVVVSLQDEKGNLLSHTGAVAPAFIENDLLGYPALDAGKDIHGLYQGTQRSWRADELLGNRRLKDGETLQALYQRADGSWAMLPIVMKNGAVAISIPSFSGAVKVVFVIAKGASLEEIPVAATKSPRT